MDRARVSAARETPQRKRPPPVVSSPKTRTVGLMIRQLLLLLAAVALVVPAAWGAVMQPVKIGLAVGITGDISVYGEPIRNAFALAFRQINERGEVKIDPILEDTGQGRDGAIN